MKRPLANSRSGMTLIEIIVTLTVLGLVASMLFTYYFAGQKTSSIPLTRLDGDMKLNAVMTQISSDWATNGCCKNGNSAALTALQTRITSFNANYGALCGTCSAVTSTPASFGGVTTASSVLSVTVTNSTTGQSMTNVYFAKN